MTDQTSQVDTKADDTQAVDANKQEQKLSPEAATEEMRQARAEAARYRTERNELAKQLKDATAKAEKGSELEKTLGEITGKMAKLEVQSAFFSKAHAAGVRNLDLAYLAAQQADLLSDKGDCDFAKLKTQYPELFLVAPPANAGAGANGQQTHAQNMNDFILAAAGRRR